MANENEDQNNSGAGENQDNKNQSIKPDEELSAAELAVQKENEDFILNFKEEDFEDDDKKAKLEEALKNAKTTVAQKRHYRDKFQELSKAAKPTKPEIGKLAPAAPTAEADDTPTLVLEFRQDNPWASKEVAAEVVRTAKLNNETIEQTVKRPMVANWLKNEKQTADVEAASVSPSRKGSGSGGGAEDRDWSNASLEEVEKQRQKILALGRQQ